MVKMNQKLEAKIMNNYDDINPFNISAETEKLIEEFPDLRNFNIVDIENALIKAESKYKGSPCNTTYKVKGGTINIVIIEILKYLINESDTDKDFIPVSDIYEKDYENREFDVFNQRNFVKKALGYLKCFLIVKLKKEGIKTFYKVNLDHWFEYQKYAIFDKELLFKLTPLIVEYCKSSEHATLPSFLDILDDSLEYLSQPYLNHNLNHVLEQELIKNINEEISIRIIVKESKKKKDILSFKERKVHTKIVKIIPKRIIVKDKSKFVEYEDDNVKKEIAINNIVRVMLDKNQFTTQKSIKMKSSGTNSVIRQGNNYYTCNPSFVNAFVEPSYFSIKEQRIILELEYVALEYYKTKPVNNIEIYATEVEKETFSEKYKHTIKDSKFYVVCFETNINAVNNILHVIDVVKILEPMELIGEVDRKINSFKRNNPW